MRARQWVITAMAGVAGFAVVALALTFAIAPRQVAQSAGVASIGGPFTLVDDTGATVTEKTLAGKPYAMYFGYRYCPDVCPTTLFDLTRWIKMLGPDGDKLNYVFVTVDPERDTPKLMHEYLASFDRRIRGFTGTPAQIAKIAKEYRVYYKKVPTSGGGYLMDHSAMIYLMTADDKFDTVIPYQEKDSVALAKLRDLIAAAAVVLIFLDVNDRLSHWASRAGCPLEYKSPKLPTARKSSPRVGCSRCTNARGTPEVRLAGKSDCLSGSVYSDCRSLPCASG